MSKTNEQLLLDYKKANKEARKKIVAKAGFLDESEYIAHLLNDPKPSSKFFKKNDEKLDTEDGMLDQVIAFDTTGSMSSYIGAVKKHVKELIPKLFEENQNLRLKIVAFGDYCDMRSATEFGAAYQQSELTNNQGELIDFVTNAQNTGGGDGDEFYELVIKKITEETMWRPRAKKAVLLIADYYPHPVGYSYSNIVRNSQIDWKEEAKKSAALGIQWDTMTCIDSYVRTFYKPLSDMTNGICIPFHSSHKTQDILYAATSARGGEKSRAAFKVSYTAAMSSGDTELIGSYKSLRSLLDE